MNKPLQKTPVKPSAKINYLLILVVLALVVFAPIFLNDFINLDDPQYILDNPDIQKFSIDNIKRLFTSTYVGNYQPVSMLTYLLEYTFAGANPRVFHSTNLLFHLFNTVLIYAIFFRLVNNKNIAFITAALFCIHPLHVESVAWAAARKDLVYTFFFLSSIFFYLKYGVEKKKLHLIFSLLLFILSILSKAQAVVLPVVLLLLDYLQKRTINKKVIIEKAPFFLLSLIFGALAFYVQKKSGAVQDFTYFPFLTRILFTCYGLMGYFYKLFLPFNLSCFYPYPETNDIINTNWVYFAPVIIAVIGFIIYKYGRTSREITFGVLFFLLTIALVLQLIPVGDAVMADRYTYIPFIGLFFIAAHFYNKALEKKKKAGLIKTAGIGVILALALLSFVRCTQWKDSITLYNTSADKYPAAIIYNNRGAALSKIDKHKEALEDFNKVLQLKPRYPNGHQNRGLTLQKLNMFAEAINDFSAEIKMNTKNTAAYNNRANCNKALNKYKEAIDDFTTVIGIDPNNIDAYYNRGESYGRNNNLPQSIADFDKVISLKPDYAEAYSNRGIAYSLSGNIPKALEDFNKAIQMKPEAYNSYMNRAVALKSVGRYKEALKDAQFAKQNGQAVDDAFIKELETLSKK